jgi:Protein of unknown function (DUF3592)
MTVSTTEQEPRSLSIVWIVLGVLFGGVLIAVSVVEINQNLHLVQTGLRTTGIIVANEYHYKGRYEYYPVVRFVAQGGQTYVVQSRFGAEPPEFRQGENVTVYYDPRHPQTALIDSWKDLWLGPLGWIVVGTVFVLLGAWKEAWKEESHQATSESASETIIHEETGAHPAQDVTWHPHLSSSFLLALPGAAPAAGRPVVRNGLCAQVGCVVATPSP